MDGAGVPRFSCTPSSSCHSPRTRRAPAAAASVRCTRWSFIRSTAWSPVCSSWNSGASWCGTAANFALPISGFWAAFRMKIDHVELYELTLPLAEPFIISGGAITERQSLLVRLVAPDGVDGWGECPPFALPFYSEETLAGARDMLE